MAERRGFAAMDENLRRQIASRGGRAAHQTGNAHEWNEREAAEAGRKGGQKVSRNRQHMAEIGRRGGLAAHQRGAAPARNEEANGGATAQEEAPRNVVQSNGEGQAHEMAFASTGAEGESPRISEDRPQEQFANSQQ